MSIVIFLVYIWIKIKIQDDVMIYFGVYREEVSVFIGR